VESNHSNGKKLVSKSSYLKNPTRMHFYQCRTAAISEHLVNFYAVNHRWKKDNSSNAQTNIHETINMDDGSHIALKLNTRNNRLESISKVVLTHSEQREARVYSIPKLSSNECAKIRHLKMFSSLDVELFSSCVSNESQPSNDGTEREIDNM
jgi:hypothetical protein